MLCRIIPYQRIMDYNLLMDGWIYAILEGGQLSSDGVCDKCQGNLKTNPESP